MGQMLTNECIVQFHLQKVKKKKHITKPQYLGIHAHVVNYKDNQGSNYQSQDTVMSGQGLKRCDKERICMELLGTDTILSFGLQWCSFYYLLTLPLFFVLHFIRKGSEKNTNIYTYLHKISRRLHKSLTTFAGEVRGLYEGLRDRKGRERLFTVLFFNFCTQPTDKARKI